MTDLKCDHAWQKIPDPAAICPKCWSIKTEFSVFPPTESFAAGETPAQAPGQEERPLRASSLPPSSGSVLRKADAGGANIHPSSDVKELVERLKALKIRTLFDEDMGRWEYDPLPQDAATMLQAQAKAIERLQQEDGRWHHLYKQVDAKKAALTEKLEAQEKEYEKLEAKFWEVRDAGIKAEDALEALTEKLERYRELVRRAVDNGVCSEEGWHNDARALLQE